MDSRLRGNDNGGFGGDNGGVEGSAKQAKVETETSSEASLRPPPEDPTIRVIHCEPPVNYAAHGMIPPWAQRIY